MKLIGFLAAILLLAPSVLASTTLYIAPEAPKAPRTIDELIVDKATEYGVSASLMRQIVKCESSGNPNAVGDYGNSFGLVQIHLPSHPQVTREQALDPEFALDFLASRLAQGQGKLWTCYRLLY